MVKISDANITSLLLDSAAGIPTNPPTGKIRLYVDPTSLLLSVKDDTGTTYTVAGTLPPITDLTLTEGAEPAAPTSGHYKAYIDIGDHHLKTKSSAGVVVDLQGISTATPQATATTGAAGTGTLPAADDHVHAQGNHDHATTTGHGGHIPAGSVNGLATVATSGAYSDLTGTPTVPPVSAVTPQPTGTAGAAGTDTAVAADDHVHQLGSHDHATTTGHGGHIPATSVTGLATVATTGAYSDLTGRPTVPTVSAVTPQPTGTTGSAGTDAAVAADDHVHAEGNHDHAATAGHGGHIPAGSVSGLATVATTGAYSDLSGAPSLATVASTGDHADLTDVTADQHHAKAHDHTTGDGSGVLTNDEHDGYSQLGAIATPSTPAAGKVRTYAKTVLGVTGLYAKGEDGVEVGPLGASGSSTLAADTDVALTSPADSDLLTFDSGAGKWENKPPSTATPQATGTTGSAGAAGAVSAAGHVHALGDHDHAATAGHGAHIPESSVTGLVSDLAAKAASSSLATVATSGLHADLASVTADQHHNKSHAHNGADGSGTVAYADLTSKPTIPSILDDLTDVQITSVANGDVPIWNAGDSKWENGPQTGGATIATPGALVLLEQHVASASAHLDFTNFIDSSKYDVYMAELVDIVPGTTGTEMEIQFSTDGGVTFSNSGYDWSHSGVFMDSTTQDNQRAQSAAAIVLGGTNPAMNTNVGAATSAWFRLNGLSNPGVYPTVVGQYIGMASNGVFGTFTQGGAWHTATAVNAVRFVVTSGNVASGTVRIYGIAKTALSNPVIGAQVLGHSETELTLTAATGVETAIYQVTVTTNGEPVLILGHVGGTANGANADTKADIYRDGTRVTSTSLVPFRDGGVGQWGVSADASYVDTPSAGSHVYSIRITQVTNLLTILAGNGYIQVTKLGGSPAGSGTAGSSYLLYQEQQPQNTVGGAFNSGAWRTRLLNTEVADPDGHGTLSGNQITLDAGTYELRGWANAHNVNQNKLRWYNITDSVAVIYGNSNYQPSGTPDGDGVAIIEGRFTIAGAKTFELQHICATSHATDGFGTPGNFAVEIYSGVELRRVAAPVVNTSGGTAIAIISDQKANGSNGGVFTSGAWRTRDLNTIESDTLAIVSVAANRFTLQAGTYVLHASAPALFVNTHRLRIYNITDSVVMAEGPNYHAQASTGDATAQIDCKFTLVAAKVFELQHICETTNGAAYGMGAAASLGSHETYAMVEIEKITSSSGSTGGLVLLEQQTVSGAATIDFKSWFTSDYDEYVVEILNAIPSATADLCMQVSTDGGATYDTGNNYHWAFHYTANIAADGQVRTSPSNVIGIFTSIEPTLEGVNGQVRLYNPGGTTYRKTVTTDVAASQGSAVFRGMGFGLWANTAAYNAFRMTYSTGTITGTVRVYGVPKTLASSIPQTEAYLLYEDHQSSGVDGGTLTSGSWQTRVLNTEVSDDSGIGTLASNQITLPAGTYRVSATAPAVGCQRAQLRLRDITNSATLVTGTSCYAGINSPTSSVTCVLKGSFVLTGATVIELQQQCQATVSSIGLGVAGSFGTEVYASVELRKVA